MTSDLPAQREFFKQLGGRPQIAQLFDELPDIYFFTKNVRGEFVLCNSATLAALALVREADMIGKLFGSTPLRYVNRYRLRAACMELRQTHENISTIAHRVGFYDHAHFVRQFRIQMKMTPTEYRERHQTKDE